MKYNVKSYEIEHYANNDFILYVDLAPGLHSLEHFETWYDAAEQGREYVANGYSTDFLRED